MFYRVLIYIYFIITFISINSSAQSGCTPNPDIPSGICCEGCVLPAPILCDINDLDGFCGRTGEQAPLPQFDGFCGPNTVTDNPSWFGFVSSGGNITIQLAVSNCLNNRGVQFAIYNGCSGNPPVACQSNCQGNGEVITLTVPNTIPGNSYYVMVDGCRFLGVGDQCDYEFTIIEGEGPEIGTLTQPNGPLLACPGQTFEYTFPEVFKATTYGVTMPDGSSFETSTRSFSYTFPAGTPPGTYQFCLDYAANACDTVSGPNCLNIIVQPLPEVIEGPFLVCNDEYPVTVRGIDYFEPGTFEYVVSGTPECDTVIIVEIEELINEPDTEVLVVCPDEFPLNSPYNNDVYPGPGVYIVPWQDERGCDSTFGLYVATTEFFFIVFTEPDSLYCEFDFVEIDASNVAGIISDGTEIEDIEYSWYFNGNLLFGESENRLQAYEEGVYTIVVQGNILGASCIDSFDIEIGRGHIIIPEFQINGPAEICQQAEFTYSITNFDNFSYTWSVNDPDIQLSVGSNNLSASIVASDLGDFDICLTSKSLICPDDDPIITCRTIQVTDLLTPGITGDHIKCPDTTARIFVAEEFASYTWSNGLEGREIFVGGPGTYTVSITDSGGCPGVNSFTVTDFPQPTAQIVGVSEFCFGDTVILSIDGVFTSYKWSDDSTDPELNVSESGLYAITVTDENGCTAVTSREVVKQPELVLSISGATSFCTGESVVLSGTSGFSEYLWSTGGTSQTEVINLPGEITLNVVDELGCTAESTVILVENPLPDILIQSDRNPICPLEDVLLQLSENFPVIDWSTGAVGTTSILVNESGIYGVTVTDSNGCENEEFVEITEFETEDPQFTEGRYFCFGTAIDVGVVNEFSHYRWSNDLLTSIITIQTAGVYTVTVTDVNGCETTGQVEIEESPLPEPEIIGSSRRCQGEEAVLEIIGDFENYEWGTMSVSSSITVTSSGTYGVTVTDERGCLGTDEFTITFVNNPNPQISGSRSFCTGRSTTLGGGNFSSYLWTTGEETPVIVVNIAGSYGLTVTDENGCTGTSGVTIIEADRLFPEITGDLSICEGNSTELDAGGGFAVYEWSTGDITSSIVVSEEGMYSITVTDADGCSGDVEVLVVVNENPEFEIMGVDYFCPGRSTTLDAGMYVGYVWSTGSLNRTINVSRADIYGVTVTDINGCMGAAQIEIIELEDYSPEVFGDRFFCTGSSTVLVAEDGYDVYVWNDGNTSRERVIISAGTYILTVEDQIGCEGSTSVTIIEQPLPVALAGPGGELTCTDTLIVIGSNQSSQGPEFSFIWERITGSVTDTLSTSLLYEVDRPGSYRLTVINDETGCISRDNVMISVNDDVITGAEILVLDPRCFGDQNGIININRISGGTAPYTIQVNGNGVSLNQNVSNLGPGTYHIQISDINGCRWSETFEINTTDSLGVTIDLEGDLLIDEGDTVRLSPLISVPVDELSNIIWLEGNELICEMCEDLALTVMPLEQATFQVRIEDERGCFAFDQVTIYVRKRRDVYIPNAFSPNSDGTNDYFVIYGGDNVSVIESIEIFDRWGNQVYAQRDMLPGSDERAFDGTFRGRELQPGVYVYSVSVRFEDGEVLHYYGEVAIHK